MFPFLRSSFEAFQPDIQSMICTAPLKDPDIRGVIVSVKGSKEMGYCNDHGEQFDFVSRYFAPWFGINEDPVTGKKNFILHHCVSA